MSEQFLALDITKLDRDPNQPRKTFDAEALRELSTSIKAQGIIQPIIVRENPKKAGHYFVVAGERRYRAAKKAKLSQVPVIVKSDSLAEVRSIQLTENFHREDLTLLEILKGVNEFIAESEKKVTNKMLADRFGQSSTYWSRIRKLDKAPEQVLEYVNSGKMTNINVISTFVSLYETDKTAFQDVWGDMVNDNITTNLEKYVASQLRMVKELKQFGFIKPEPNEHGVYSESLEGVTRLFFNEGRVRIVLNVLQTAQDKWATGHSLTVLDSGTGVGISDNSSYDSETKATVAMLELAGNFLVNTIKDDRRSIARGPLTKKAFNWVNDQLESCGAETRFEMPEAPAPLADNATQTETTEEAANPAADVTPVTEQENEQPAAAQDEKIAVLQESSDNVVSFESRKESLPGTVTFDVPNAIQEQVSRLCGYYYAVSNSMSEQDAIAQIEMMVTNLAGSSQRKVH